MGIVFGIIVAVGTIVWVGLIALANRNSDAPSQQSRPVWPVLVTGIVISVFLIGSHYFPIPW